MEQYSSTTPSTHPSTGTSLSAMIEDQKRAFVEVDLFPEEHVSGIKKYGNTLSVLRDLKEKKDRQIDDSLFFIINSQKFAFYISRLFIDLDRGLPPIHKDSSTTMIARLDDQNNVRALISLDKKTKKVKLYCPAGSEASFRKEFVSLLKNPSSKPEIFTATEDLQTYIQQFCQSYATPPATRNFVEVNLFPESSELDLPKYSGTINCLQLCQTSAMEKSNLFFFAVNSKTFASYLYSSLMIAMLDNEDKVSALIRLDKTTKKIKLCCPAGFEDSLREEFVSLLGNLHIHGEDLSALVGTPSEPQALIATEDLQTYIQQFCQSYATPPATRNSATAAPLAGAGSGTVGRI